MIAEQEGAGESLMSRDFLSQVIRSYGSGLQDFVGRYLDESIQLFASEQRELRDRFKNVVGIDPLETVTSVAQKNYQRWKSAAGGGVRPPARARSGQERELRTAVSGLAVSG